MIREKCLSKISRLVPDPTVRKFIFGSRYSADDFLTSTDEINGYFSNILNLTFSLLYAKYRRWRQQNGTVTADDSAKFNSYLRVSKIFQELYIEKNLGFDIIEPTIIDAQLDIYYHGVLADNLRLEELLNPDKGNRFAHFIHTAAVARTSSRMLQGQEKLEDKYDELIEYLQLFPYLSKISLKTESLGEDNLGSVFLAYGSEKITFPGLQKVNIVLESVDDEELDTFMTLINIGDDFYFLEEIVFDSTQNSTEKDLLYCNYSHIGSENNYLRVNVTANENFIARDNDLMIVSPKALRGVLRELHVTKRQDGGEEKVFIKDFYAINYCYIKQLSLAVSHILSADNKESFRINYALKYEELFKSKSWDTIIAVLLVKESAISVLKYLFSIDNSAYSNLLYNLQTRFGSDVFDAAMLEADTKKEIDSSFERWVHSYFGENRVVSEISNRVIETERLEITSEVKALMLVEYLSKILKVNENDAEEYRNKYPLNLNSHIRMLDWLIKTDIPSDRKKERCLQIVMKTLKTLYIFYQGFFKYVEIKTEFKEKSKFIVFTGKEIAEFQANANAAFRREVKCQLKRLSEPDYSSVTALLNEIKLLNDECTFVKGRHTKNEIIRDSLGRHQLLDFSQLLPLEEYLSFTNTDDSREINLRIEKILKVYHYLQCGSDDSSDIDGIYPYVGTYEYSHETRDGYKVAHFSISSSSHEKALDIEILSEFRYSINGKYYCLPNKMCCNNELKLWIEPTVISYKNFVMVDEDE